MIFFEHKLFETLKQRNRFDIVAPKVWEDLFFIQMIGFEKVDADASDITLAQIYMAYIITCKGEEEIKYSTYIYIVV